MWYGKVVPGLVGARCSERNLFLSFVVGFLLKTEIEMRDLI